MKTLSLVLTAALAGCVTIRVDEATLRRVDAVTAEIRRLNDEIERVEKKLLPDSGK